MRRLRFARQEGMLGVLFYPRDFGQSPTERLAIPKSGGLETSLHARPHMCDHQFFHQRELDEALRVGRVRDLQRY